MSTVFGGQTVGFRADTQCRVALVTLACESNDAWFSISYRSEKFVAHVAEERMHAVTVRWRRGGGSEANVKQHQQEPPSPSPPQAGISIYSFVWRGKFDLSWWLFSGRLVRAHAAARALSCGHVWRMHVYWLCYYLSKQNTIRCFISIRGADGEIEESWNYWTRISAAFLDVMWCIL